MLSGQTFTTFAVTLIWMHKNFFFFFQDTLAYDDVPWDVVWLSMNKQFIRYSRKSHLLIIWALADLDPQYSKHFFLHDTPAHDAASSFQVLVTKCSVVQKISDKQSPTFWTFAVTLTLSAMIQFFSQNTPAYDAAIKQSLIAKGQAV